MNEPYKFGWEMTPEIAESQRLYFEYIEEMDRQEKRRQRLEIFWATVAVGSYAVALFFPLIARMK